MEPPLAQDPDFSPPDSLHFYSPLIHFDSLPGWKLSLSLTIFGHFLSPFFSSLNLLGCVLRLTSGSKTSSPNLTAHLGGGHRGRRPVAGPFVGSRRNKHPGENAQELLAYGQSGVLTA